MSRGLAYSTSRARSTCKRREPNIALIQHFTRNLAGRDFVVGDIHGHFSRLASALEKIGFNAEKDRLFSVGDLVDRGPESEQSLQWLQRPWFHAVCGNHEDYAIRHALTGGVDLEVYRANGGDWLIRLPKARQVEFARAFDALPHVVEVETENGLIGILHADCPVRDWNQLAAMLSSKRVRDFIIWSRARLESGNPDGILNIRAVVVGHTPIQNPLILGNVVHIDTGGWFDGGYFTVLDLNELSRRTFRSIAIELPH